MGVKGFVRSVVAAQRRLEREALRRQRELEKERQHYAKMQELEQAQYEVQVHENHIEVITTLHKQCSEYINWDSLVRMNKPIEPKRDDVHERKAKAAFDNYKPNTFDKLFSKVEKKVEKLKNAIIKGTYLDEQEYHRAKLKFETDYENWKQSTEFASRIVSGDTEAYLEAIKEFDPFSEISLIGSSIKLNINDPKLIVAEIKVNGESVIPKNYKYLLQSGKLSERPLTKTKFYALYQDYVCSAILRVARELFALLPIDMVIGNAVGEILNSSTGYFEEKPILSVAIPRETLMRLNFELLDPSDSLANFVHRMKFQTTKGFLPIKTIDPSELTQ